MKKFIVVEMAQGYLNGLKGVLLETVEFLRREKLSLKDKYDRVSQELDEAEENLERVEDYLKSRYDQ